MATRAFIEKATTTSLLALAAGLFAGALATRRRAYSLQGKNAVVTGGSRGLGLEIARVLVRKGANVAIVARDEAELNRALEELHGTPLGSGQSHAIGVACDLLEEGAIETMLEAIRSILGPIDVLVNNAGSIQVGPLDSMTIDDFEDAMQLHCFSPLRAMLGVRDDMRARGGGRIANIASIGGVVSVPHLLPYSASKFALMGLSQGMRPEFARDDILVSTIAPGLMRTGSPRRARFKGDHRKEYGWFAVSDSLPFLSVSSERAASRIVRALERGEPHVVIGLPAKIAALAAGVAPGLVAHALTLANAALPDGDSDVEYAGFESESALVPSMLTRLSEQAALRNNET